MVRGFYEQLYANKLDNLEKMKKSLKQKPSEIESVTKKPLNKKKSRNEWLHW